MTFRIERSNGNFEKVADKEALKKRLYYINKSIGTKPMTMAQCGAVVNNIVIGKVNKFCGRIIEVEV